VIEIQPRHDIGEWKKGKSLILKDGITVLSKKTLGLNHFIKIVSDKDSSKVFKLNGENSAKTHQVTLYHKYFNVIVLFFIMCLFEFVPRKRKTKSIVLDGTTIVCFVGIVKNNKTDIKVNILNKVLKTFRYNQYAVLCG
jgi:hypothetical protein